MTVTQDPWVRPAGSPQVLGEGGHMNRLRIALATISVVVMGCSGALTSTSSIGSAAPSTTSAGAGSIRPSPTTNVVSDPPTEPPTAAPTEPPTPEPSASVAKVRETVRPCESGAYVRAMVIVELVNEGDGWAELSGGDYTVFDGDENVIGTGRFTYSYPKYLAPGATGYLADDGIFEDTNVKSVKRVEADGTYDDVEADEVIEFNTAKVSVKRAAYGDGLHTTGTVTNASSIDVRGAHVGSFFLDAKGVPIGYASTNLIDNLRAGKTKGFETIDSWCPVNRTAVKKVVTFAADDDF